MGSSLGTGGSETENAKTGEYEQIQPVFKNGRFKNPFATFETRTLGQLLRMLSSKDNSNIPWSDKEELNRNLPIVTPNFDKLNKPPCDKVQLMWIGHASILVQFDGITVLTDPVWSERCGPFGKIGPRRYRGTPCKIDELPNVDAVIISHNHYDHLDYDSVVKLNEKFGQKLHWFVAQGQAEWMRKAGCDNVVELSWWNEYIINKNGVSYMFACTPSQHWCKRTSTDTNKALWCSWIVKGPRHNFFFGGDTGYCCAFKQIGNKYGPFTLAAIPIGAYEPRWFMKPQHCNPDEAVTIHQELKSKRSVGIHWGTFRLTSEHYMEPKQTLTQTVKDRFLDERAFFTVSFGDVITLDDDDDSNSRAT